MAFTYRGKTALVTGASGGIGAAFAEALAARGMDLILVARSAATLNTLAQELSARHGIEATAIPADLSQPAAVPAIIARMAELGLRCDLLLNNAGFGSYGAFTAIDPAREREQILVNVAALVDLTHAVLPQMLARGSGAVVNIASTVAFQPVPYMTTYSATKAFVLSFSSALAAECRARGVQVLALCPGPTETGFFAALNNAAVEQKSFLSRRASVADVVGVGLRALERRRMIAVVGRLNRLLTLLPRLLPREWVAAIGERIFRTPGGHSTAPAR